jgi:hypothetical protein
MYNANPTLYYFKISKFKTKNRHTNCMTVFLILTTKYTSEQIHY